MEPNDIISGNITIIKFMGLEHGWWIHQDPPLTDDKKQWCDIIGTTFLGSKVYYNHDIQFHTSWDWLMPAWIKLHSKVCDLGKGKFIDMCNEPWYRKSLEMGFGLGDIDIAFPGVVAGINWYLNNK